MRKFKIRFFATIKKACLSGSGRAVLFTGIFISLYIAYHPVLQPPAAAREQAYGPARLMADKSIVLPAYVLEVLVIEACREEAPAYAANNKPINNP